MTTSAGSGARGCAVAMRCPDCRGDLEFEPAGGQELPGGRFGVLTCGCASYPVLDDIPVIRRGRVDVHDHMTGRSEVRGPRIEDLTAMVRAGRGVDALIELLAFPPPVPWRLGSRPGWRLPFTRGPWPRAMLAARRGEVAAMLSEVDALTAQDWMELCYARSSEQTSPEILPYFFKRYGQPRYLASLSLLRVLPHDPRPVLDLACGFGHLLYHLQARQRPVHAVGVDRNFFQVWVGRRYVAPGQTFICADRPDALPFADETFAAAMCTDAFHLFERQQTCLDEMRRCAYHHTVVLDRVGNARLEPHDTDAEREPAGYVELLRGAPCRIVSEDELIAGYLTGRGPQLAAPRDPAGLDDSKWISIVSSSNETLFADDPGFVTDRAGEPTATALPHAAGALRINPIYQVEPDDSGVHLRFAYPSTWYAFENSLMSSFTSAGERLDRATFDLIAEGHASGPQLDLYLRRFVVLGMPPRYARRPGTPPRTTLTAGLLNGVLHRVRSRSWGR